MYHIAKYNLKKIVKIKTERICRWGSVKCRLSTDWVLLFLGLENNGLLLSSTHLHGENNSPQYTFNTK